MIIYPKITFVTPSYNQGEFIEDTILSIINQNYPNLEYIIIDGGSKDNTVEIIKKYEQHITFWVSEKDNGQSHAINKGFARATGAWGIWINSDDMLAPGALHKIAERLARAPKSTMLMGQYHEVDRYGENPKLKH
ncbi:MAG: glycosyltransferase, partial [Bacteroidota bacterium]